MKIKRFLAIILIIVIQQMGICCITEAEELPIVKSYYLLKYEYGDFLTPLLYNGATEPEIIAFFNDIEIQLKKIEGITEQNFEKHFRDTLINVATYRAHRNISSVVFTCYEKEIAEYLETNVIPARMSGAYNALLKILFGTSANDKVELALLYERYKKVQDAGLSQYTVSSAEAFSSSMANTLNVLKKTDATLDEILNVKTALLSAYSNLERKPQIIPSGGSGGSSSGASSGGGGSSGGSVPSGTGQQNNGSALVESEVLFNDLTEAHWSYPAVKYLVDKKVINGFEDKTFRPEQLVTREEISKMLCVALNLAPAEIYTEYSDVEKNAWYDDYLQRVTAADIMQGTGNKLFGIGKTLLRQDLAVIAYRLITNGTVSNNYTISSEYVPFSDLSLADEYAKDAIEMMKKYSIINGTGNNLFEPYDGVTRAQAAQIIYSLVK